MPANKGRNVVLGIAATMLVGVVIVLSNGAKMLEAGDELVLMHNKGQGMPEVGGGDSFTPSLRRGARPRPQLWRLGVSNAKIALNLARL